MIKPQNAIVEEPEKTQQKYKKDLYIPSISQDSIRNNIRVYYVSGIGKPKHSMGYFRQANDLRFKERKRRDKKEKGKHSKIIVQRQCSARKLVKYIEYKYYYVIIVIMEKELRYASTLIRLMTYIIIIIK